MKHSWVISTIELALNIWNGKLGEILTLITESPQEFKNGEIWKVMKTINTAMQGVGLALLILFFVVGVIKTCGSFAEAKKPEHVVKIFVRFAIAKALVTYGLDLLMSIFEIGQGIISSILRTANVGNVTKSVLPEEIIKAIDSVNFLESVPIWLIAFIGCLMITVLSFVMILTVYGRFFKLYLYTAIAPIPLSTFAGEPTQHVGRQFLKSFCAVCLEGAIIVLACIIFSVFASTPPEVDTGVKAATMVWKYLGELIFNMLVLVGTIKASDRIVREMMGL